MQVKCLHGYFKFEETAQGQLSDFIDLYGLSIVSSGDHFTFEALKDAPRYSIAGGEYLGATATKTYEGEPWEVMRANGLVYDFINDRVVQLTSITQRVNIYTASRYYLSNGLLLPGSIKDDGLRVTDYSAFFILTRVQFRYTEVTYE